MRLYEGMFLVDNSEARKNYDAVNENITRIITKYGGEVIRSERWSERRLAYPVRRRDRGTYVLVYFNASPESITEIRRDCAIDEVILRNMILRANAVPEDEPKSEASAEPEKEIAEEAEPVTQETPKVPPEETGTGPEIETQAQTEETQESTEAEPAGEAPVDEKEDAVDAPAE